MVRIHLPRILGTIKMSENELSAHHWMVSLGVAKPRTVRLSASKTHLLDNEVLEDEPEEPPENDQGFAHKEASKLRAHIRRLSRAGVRNINDICAVLKDRELYPKDTTGYYLPKVLIATTCIRPVLEFEDRQSTYTHKILDMLDDGKTRSEIAVAIGKDTRYVAACIFQVSKRNKCSMDYMHMGLEPPKRKRKSNG